MLNQSNNKAIVCIGAALVDDSFLCLNEPYQGTSNPARHYRSAGGVARNIAHHLAQLGNPVELITHFGEDEDGPWLKGICSTAGIGLSHALFTKTGTGRFTGILSPTGELFAGASDTHLEEALTVGYLEQQSPFLSSASLVLCDCNLSVSCIAWIVDFCRSHQVPCIIEPVSVAKAAMLRDVNLDDLLLITPNLVELGAITGEQGPVPASKAVTHLLERGVQNIWIRKGKDGSEMFSRTGSIEVPAPDVKVIDSTGAGDAALAGWIHAHLQGRSADDCILYGHALAHIILQTKGTYAGTLDHSRIEEIILKMKIV